MKPALSLHLCLVLLTACRHVQQERFPADVRINGKPVHFVYDTGAGVTLVHTRSAKRLGLKATKPPSFPKPAPGRVNIGHTEFCQFTVGSESYSLKLATVHVPWPLGGVIDFDGVIGWPDLKDDFFSIDAGEEAIKSLQGLPSDTNGWTRLPLYRRAGVLTLEIQRGDGKTGVLEVDTGNPEGVSLSPARWKQWRAAHRRAHGKWEFNFMFGSGGAIARTYEAEHLSIGPLTWSHVPIRKARRTEIGSAGEGDVFEASIGIVALRQLDLIIDRTNHMAYVRRNPDWVPRRQGRGGEASRSPAERAKSTVRLGLREHEYGDLAEQALDSGNFDAGITNLTRLLELQPDNAGALMLRSGAFLRVYASGGGETNLVRSLADSSRALTVDPGISQAYAWRASIYYLMQRWDDALTDYHRFCEKNPSEATYPRFYIWLIRARKGERVEADRELNACFAQGGKSSVSQWQKDIGVFLLGRMSERGFLSSGERGHDSGRQCEAWFYVGMKRLLAGDRSAARDYLQKCVATERRDFAEYDFAAAELKRME